MRTLWAFAILFSAAGTLAAQDLVVYDDAARNGFDGNYSFGGGTDLAETGTVFAGTASIAYTGNDEFNAVSLARAFVPDLPASQYHTLRFYVHGGTTGGQRLRLYFARDSESEAVTVADGTIDRYIEGGAIAADEWRLVSVPLADFGVTGPYDRIDLQTELGAQPVLYLDEIVLIGTPTLSIPATTVPRGVASVSLPVRFFAGTPATGRVDISLFIPRGLGLPPFASGTAGALSGPVPNATVTCGGTATISPDETGLTGSASATVPGQAIGSGTPCTFTLPLDPLTPSGSYSLVESGSGFTAPDGTPSFGNIEIGFLVIAEGTAPSVSYTPPPPSQIDLPSGALGTSVEASITAQALGGSGAGRVRLACSVGAPFALPAGNAFVVGAGDESIAVTVGCTLDATAATADLTCVETDEPGGATRSQTWPLVCPEGSAARILAGSVTGNRGGPVRVPVTFIGDGIVHSMAGNLVFDRTLLTPTQVAPVNGGTCFLQPPPNDDRITFSAPPGPSPLPQQETDYCDVVFLLAGDAPIDSTPLTLTATSCANASNGAVTCLTTDGNVATSAFDSSPRPGGVLNLVAAPGQSSANGSIVALNFGGTAIDVSSCTPSPAVGYSIVPNGAFSIPSTNFRTITVGCAAPAAGLPPLVSDLSCLLQDTDPPRVVRYRLLCSTASSQGALPGASLTGAGAGAGDEVGTAVATTVAPNGDEIMVVGAPFGGADDGGRAFVIVRPAGSGVTPARSSAKGLGALGGFDSLVPSDAHVLSAANAIGDKFGSAVAVDAAGATIAIGAPGGGAGGAGRVFVFMRPAGGWGTLETPDVTIDAPDVADADGTSPDEFGAQVAFSADGVLIVGAPFADVGAGAADAGAAYAYAPGQATPAAVLRSPQVETGAGFGGAIAANGTALAIAAPLENAGGNSDQGAVYVMTAPGAPAEPTRRVTMAAGGIGDKFGQSVAFVNRTLVVGAPADNTATGTDAGSATVFQGDTAGGFAERMVLVPPGDSSQQAGAAVATNGDVVLVGAPFAIVDGRAAQGRVFAFDVPEGNAIATPPRVIDSAAGQSGDRFGSNLAASPRRLLIGVPKDDNELGIGGTAVQVDEGRADPFLFDRISRSGFE